MQIRSKTARLLPKKESGLVDLETGVYRPPNQEVEVIIARKTAEFMLTDLVTGMLNGRPTEIVLTGSRDAKVTIDGEPAQAFFSTIYGPKSQNGYGMAAGAEYFEELLIAHEAYSPEFLDKLRSLEKKFRELMISDDRGRELTLLHGLEITDEDGENYSFDEKPPGTPREVLLGQMAAWRTAVLEVPTEV